MISNSSTNSSSKNTMTDRSSTLHKYPAEKQPLTMQVSINSSYKPSTNSWKYTTNICT